MKRKIGEEKKPPFKRTKLDISTPISTQYACASILQRPRVSIKRLGSNAALQLQQFRQELKQQKQQIQSFNAINEDGNSNIIANEDVKNVNVL